MLDVMIYQTLPPCISSVHSNAVDAEAPMPRSCYYVDCRSAHQCHAMHDSIIHQCHAMPTPSLIAVHGLAGAVMEA